MFSRRLHSHAYCSSLLHWPAVIIFQAFIILSTVRVHKKRPKFQTIVYTLVGDLSRSTVEKHPIATFNKIAVFWQYRPYDRL